MILKKFTFFFAFNLRKQNVTDFSFISVTQNFVHIVSTVAFQTMATKQPYSEVGIPEFIGMEMLFSLQIFTRN